MMGRFLPLLMALVAPAAAQIAISADRVVTGRGPDLQPGIVLVAGDRITAVGSPDAIVIPEGARRFRVAVLTPGLIDAHSVVGLAGHLNQREDSDHIERSAPMQPELRALDAFNPDERLVRHLRELGITTLHTGHAPIALIPGQTMIVKTSTGPVERNAVREEAMISLVLGDASRGTEGKSPGNRSKAVALVRARLLEAQAYAADRAKPDSKRARDLGLEVLAEGLAGRRPVMVTAQRVRDIQSALRLADEFGFKLVLDGAAEAHLVLDELVARKVPVILHPTMIRSQGEFENASMATAAKLAERGIRFAFQSGFESYVPKTRVVLFEAGVAVQHGLAPERALRALTSDAAEILGIAERTGSIEVGKAADLAGFDADPLELTSRCVLVMIDGRPVSETPR